MSLSWKAFLRSFHIKSFSEFHSNGSASGPLVQGKYVAENKNFDTQPGKFYTPVDGHDYPSWIIDLGEMNTTTQQYPWAMVSVPFGVDLFILARDVAEFQTDEYETEVLQMVRERGFKYAFNEPIATFQSATECNYPPLPPASHTSSDCKK